MDVTNMRKILLQVINEMEKQGPGYFQQTPILRETSQKLNIKGDKKLEQALLTVWHDLFRTGHIAWGYDLSNPDPPFVHLTKKGRDILKNISRDPANIDGYLNFINGNYNINDIGMSYIIEALNTYNNNCFKATAVMVGAASESIILELRDELMTKMISLGKNVPSKLKSWQAKIIIEKLSKIFEGNKLPRELKELFSSYWSSLASQIRITRNEAGHPNSISPVTEEQVYASLLIFPELLNLINKLSDWVNNNYK